MNDLHFKYDVFHQAFIQTLLYLIFDYNFDYLNQCCLIQKMKQELRFFNEFKFTCFYYKEQNQAQ